jgi:hypothetical protein
MRGSVQCCGLDPVTGPSLLVDRCLRCLGDDVRVEGSIFHLCIGFSSSASMT